MHKLRATITKDFRVLMRDKIGIALMFGMPVLLVIIVTSIQNSTFELMNKNKITVLIYNLDSGRISKEFIDAVDKIGMFRIELDRRDQQQAKIIDRMHEQEAMLAMEIPADFSEKTMRAADVSAGKALESFGLEGDKAKPDSTGPLPLTLYYQPVLQESLRRSIEGALYSALQLVESKQVLRAVYFAVNEKTMPAGLEKSLMKNSVTLNSIPVSWDGIRHTPNASQHNVPAWTIFAMFFVVVSLGGGIVREKLSGSFTRLRTLPTSYFLVLLSKQLTYLTVTTLQAVIIFSIGIWIFPFIGLPTLDLPSDIGGLFVVTLVCGWCAVSYAICVGVFAETQEQANGFGAFSIVILAALGGLMVPGFAMPETLQMVMQLSPLHWCLETYSGLFLEGGTLADIWTNIVPILFTSVLLQAVVIMGLKMKRLI